MKIIKIIVNFKIQVKKKKKTIADLKMQVKL